MEKLPRKSEKWIGEVRGIGIPNEDVIGWLDALREGGLSESEIDKILSHLNQEYAERKAPPEVRTLFAREVERIEEEIGRKLVPAERRALLNVIEEMVERK